MSLARVSGIFSIGLMVMAAGIACGQEYPNKPIRIVTASPGSGSDGVARLIAQGVSGPLGQPVIVENRPSALTGDFAMKALPDGYTLLVEGNSFWLAPLIQTTTYDVFRDFTPITIVLLAPNVIVAHPSVPANTLSELIALAKAKPGQLNYGSSGTGSSQQLAMEMLKFMAGGINIVHVPYKGIVPALTAVIAGEVQLVAATAALTGPHIKTGKLKAYGVTSSKPSPILPGLPTIASLGLPGYEQVTRTALFACGKPPKAIIDRLHKETVRVVNSGETKEKFTNMGVEPVGNTPEQFVAIIKSDLVTIGKVIKDAGIKAN
jgi:tripartite-type tricarboxylate transporter receptor subunit TctC